MATPTQTDPQGIPPSTARPQMPMAPGAAALPSGAVQANAKDAPAEPPPMRARATATPAEAKMHLPAKPVTEYLSDNVAAMLCYLLGWLSGLVFLMIDRRPFVRFHAAQSVAVFATLHILILATGGFLLGALLPGASGALYFIRHLLELAWLVVAVVLMLKAASGERYRVKAASAYGDEAARGGH